MKYVVSLLPDFDTLPQSMQKLRINRIDPLGNEPRVVNKLLEELQQRRGLTHLHLNLEGMNMRNLEAMRVAETLQNFTTMRKLNLRLTGNLMGPLFTSEVVQAFSKLTALEVLYLNLETTGLQDEGLREVGKNLRLLPQGMRRIKLLFARNEHSFEGAAHIIESLAHLSNLESVKIDCSSEKIARQGSEQFSEALRSLSSLKKLQRFALSLQLSTLSDKDFGTIAAGLAGALVHPSSGAQPLTALKLNFYNNPQLTQRGLEALFAALRELPRLAEFSLNLIFATKLAQECGTLIASFLATLEQLQRLKLQLRETDLKEGLVPIAEVLTKKHSDSLRFLYLDLWKASLKTEHTLPLTEAIGSLNALTDLHLQLSENYLDGGDTAVHLASAIEKKQQLHSLHLDLSSNQVNSDGARALLKSLPEIKSLRELYLSLANNQGLSQVSQAILTSVKKLHNLYHINLQFQKCGIAEQERNSIWQEEQKINTNGEILESLAYALYNADGPLHVVLHQQLKKFPSKVKDYITEFL